MHKTITLQSSDVETEDSLKTTQTNVSKNDAPSEALSMSAVSSGRDAAVENCEQETMLL